MKKKTKGIFYTEDVRFWLLMNVIIIVALPLGVRIIRLAADTPINPSSFTTDFLLATFSVLFNIGVYIIGEISPEKSPQDSAKNIQDKLADALINDLINNSRETMANKLLQEVHEKLEKTFRNHLTEATLNKKKKTLEKQSRIEEAQHKQRLEEDKRLKRQGISSFFCAAFCGIAYGVGIEREYDILSLIVHIGLALFLLGLCAHWGKNTLLTMQTRTRRERQDT